MLPPPSRNAELAHVDGGFDSIVEALDYAAKGQTGICIHGANGAVAASISYRHLRERALATALKLQSLGLKRGDHVAIVAETSIDYFSIFYGCQYAGLVPCPMPYTAYLGGRSAYLAQINSLARVSRASLICLPQSLDTMGMEIEALTGVTTISFGHLDGLDFEGVIAPLRPDETAYIQFSSGSTSDPKGIVVSQHALCSNARGILRECIRITPGDRAFSWLPLYHDMGMVGFALAPLFAQISVDYLSPAGFARSPALWPELMARHGSTITYAPSFGYELAARRFGRLGGPLDLSRLRIAGVGGDMIRPAMLDLFARTFHASGFDPAAFTPSYGMAETILLASFTHGVKLDRIAAAAFETSGMAQAPQPGTKDRKFVICGKPLAGHTLIVAGENGTPVPERTIGHILIQGPSVAQSYISAQGTMPLAHDDGYLATGDMGYMADGQVVVTGRQKEVILLNGRNIWPQDIEAAITDIPGAPVKRAVAFSVEEGDSVEIVVLVEQQADREKADTLKAVVARLLATLGLSARIEIVPPRSIPYTSSGKLARSIARNRYRLDQYGSAK